jgi:hypothetical protein
MLYDDQSVYDDLKIQALRPMTYNAMKVCSKGCCYDEVTIHLDTGEIAEVERFMIDQYELNKDYILLPYDA